MYVISDKFNGYFDDFITVTVVFLRNRIGWNQHFDVENDKYQNLTS